MLALAQPAAAQAPLPQVEQPPTPQDTATVDDMVVVTASRREELLLNAPATMSVLSEDVIERAPGQSVTDLLRLVPGLNTVQSSARDVNVTSRAATGTLSDSLLVLLDGRSIYQDFFGFVAWDFLPIDTSGDQADRSDPRTRVGRVGRECHDRRGQRHHEDAARDAGHERVDSIRPVRPLPSGGVVRRRRDLCHQRRTCGRRRATGLPTRCRRAADAGAVSAADRERPGLRRSPYPAFENRGTTQPKLDARADYDLADGRQKIVLAGGISGTEGIIHTGLGPLDIQRGSTFKYGRMTYTRDRLKLQVFVNALDGESPALLRRGLDGRPLDFRFENQAYDVEFSDLHVSGTRHLLSYGGNYRHNNFDLSFAAHGGKPRRRGRVRAGRDLLFSERFRWIVGARVDRFDVLKKAVFSPRTTFSHQASGRARHCGCRSTARSARRRSSTAFSNTSFLTDMDLGAAGPFPFPTVAVGNEQLKEEALTAYEAGYIGGFGRTTLGAAVYLNRTKNTILFTQTEQLHEQPSAARLAAPAGRPGPARRAGTRAPVEVHVSEFRPHQRPRPGAVGRRPRDEPRLSAIRELHVAGRSEADRVRYLRAESAAHPPIQRRERASRAGGISAVSPAASSTPRSGRTSSGV